MNLTAQNAQEYLLKVYASWLGKIIGVRLGSPVEGWSHEKIMESYPEERGYLIDYGIYAADDDTNGPLFFVRSLSDEEEISAEKIGNAFLNYLQEYRGFFWWGGVGVSSEHTAYENLKNGIKAPVSGSMKQNGKTIAEQIGGQIFSDCWGYVAGYDPLLAKKLSSMASSVTHDGCGIEGGIFVAVAITLAMQRNDIHEVIEETLTYLDPEKEYYQVAKDILHFYEEDKEKKWEKCLSYIQENYGYDKYPGVCHIIPNMALMIMAMSYGDNDFDQTMIMLNRSGWDTDCNCGNVGSIMGALLGLEGIDERWITPINDIVNASSAIGFLNMQTVSDSARFFVELAYKLKGMEIPELKSFTLPYENKGIFCEDGYIESGNGYLSVHSRQIYRYVYYLAEDLYDARYDPEFSPVFYPGDDLYLEVQSQEKQDLLLGALDCEKESFCETHSVSGRQSIHLRIPSGNNRTIHKIFLKAEKDYRILSYRIDRHPELQFDFHSYPIDAYGPRYGGDYMSNIRGFVAHSGEWRIEDGLIGEAEEHGLISSGAYGSRYKEIVWTFIPEKGMKHQLVYNMTGYLHYDAIGFSEDRIEVIHKQQEEVIESFPYSWKQGNTYTLELREGSFLINEQEYRSESIKEIKDLFGICIGKQSRCRSLYLKTNQQWR